MSNSLNEYRTEIEDSPHAGLLILMEATAVTGISIYGSATEESRPYAITETASESAISRFNVDSFHVAPNKVSPNDKAWQDAKDFLAEWNALGATNVMTYEWLDELRTESDRRLDELYELEGRE